MNDERDVIDNLNELAQLQPSAAAVDQAIEKTRAALNARLAELPAQSIATVPFWRGFLMRPRNLIATAAAAVLIALATQWLATSSNGNIAFAQVQEQVAKTKSVQYQQTTTYRLPNGKSLPSVVNRVMISGDRLKRSEAVAESDEDNGLGPWGPSVNIYDLKKKRWAVLYPEIKGYMVNDWYGTFAEAYIDPQAEKKAAELQKNPAAKAEDKSWYVAPLPTKAPDKSGGSSSSDSPYTGETKVSTFNAPDEKIPPNTFRSSGDFHANVAPDLKNLDAKAQSAAAKSQPAAPRVNAEVVTGDKPVAVGQAFTVELDTNAAKSDEKKSANTDRKPTADWTYSADGPNWAAMKPAPQLDIYELVRHLPTEKATKLPEKTIDGRRAVGFLVEQKEHRGGIDVNWQHTWWVDRATKLPLELEIVEHNSNEPAGESKTVIDKIVFDAPLDATQFSVDMPNGYYNINEELKKAEPRLMAYVQKPNRMNTVRFVETQTAKAKDGRQLPSIVKHVTLLDNRLKREEVTVESASGASSPSAQTSPSIESHIGVLDAKQKKSLVLLPDQKEYFDPAQAKFASDYLQPALGDLWPTNYHNLGLQDVFNFAGKYKRLPLVKIDDRLVYGEVVKETKQHGDYSDVFSRTCWVDMFDNQPVRVEGTFRSADPNKPDVNWIADHFEEGDPVDRSLFSIDPPTDYKQISSNSLTEGAVAEGHSDETSGPANKKTDFVFADVQEEVDKAKSLQYTETSTTRRIDNANESSNDAESGKRLGPRPPFESNQVDHVKILGLNLIRTETTTRSKKAKDSEETTHSIVRIHDYGPDVELQLYPERKQFLRVEQMPLLPPSEGTKEKLGINPAGSADASKNDHRAKPDFYSWLQDVPADAVQHLPEKTIDDKKVMGFVREETTEKPIGKRIQKTTYWLDPDTKQPVRIERHITGPAMGARPASDQKSVDVFNLGQVETDQVITDIVFNAKLDPALFSTDPPEGYIDIRKRSADNAQKAPTVDAQKNVAPTSPAAK